MKRRTWRAALAVAALPIVGLSAGTSAADTIPTFGGQWMQAVHTQEKIAPGVTLYHYDLLQPPDVYANASDGESVPSSPTYLDVNALVVDLNSPGVSIAPIVSSNLNAIEPISTMAQNAGAIAAINSDEFNFATGNESPISALDINGQVLKSDDDQTEAQNAPGDSEQDDMALEQNGSFVMVPAASSLFTGTVTAGGQSFPLHGLNTQSLTTNSIVEYTPQWGTANRAQHLCAVGSTSCTNVSVGSTSAGIEEVIVGSNGQVSSVASSVTSAVIPSGGFVLEGAGSGATELAGLTAGEQVSTSYHLSDGTGNPIQWMAGGQIPIVANGQPIADPNAGDGNEAPFPAVGWSKDGKTVIFAAIDGWEPTKTTSTDFDPGIHRLDELPELMMDLGAYNAVSDDGGGSTELVARSAGGTTPTVRNDPTDGDERQNTMALGVFDTIANDDPSTFLINSAQPSPDNDGYSEAQSLTDIVAPLTWSPAAGQLDSDNGSAPTVFAGGHLQLSAQSVNAAWGAPDRSVSASAWSTSGGSISSAGLLAAPNTPDATVTVTAAGGGISGSQSVNVIGPVNTLSGPAGPLSFANASSAAQSVSLTGRDGDGFGAPVSASDLTLSYDSSVIKVTDGVNGALEVQPRTSSGATVLTASDGAGQYVIPVVVGGAATPSVIQPPIADPAVASNDTAVSSPASGDWRFGAIAGPKVASTGDAPSTQLTDAVKHAVADGDQLLFIDGGVTANGTSAQLAAAKSALTAGGCTVSTGDPSASAGAGTVPCVVLPGASDAPSDTGDNSGTSLFESNFGVGYRNFTQNGTQFLTLDSSQGGYSDTYWAQDDGAITAIRSAIANSAVRRLVVFTSEPDQPVPDTTGPAMTSANGLNAGLDGSALQAELAQVAAAGKQAILVTGDARVASVTRTGGVIDVSLPPIAGAAGAPAAAGGFDGQSAFDVGTSSSGLSIDLEPQVSSAALSAPATITAGTATPVSGSFTLSDGATVAAAYPASPQWVAGAGLAIGSGATAVAAAKAAGDVAIFDPGAGTITGLTPGTVSLTLEADNASGSLTPVSATQTIAVDPQPEVTLQNTTLYFDAGADPQASYVSSLAGAAVAGGVVSPLDLSGVDFATPGVYRVEVGGTVGGATAAPATLTIEVESAGAPLGRPAINVQHELVTYAAGADPTAAVVAGAAGATITHGSLDPIDLSGVAFSTPGRYTATITGGDGGAEATPSTLTIVVVPPPVVVALDPVVDTTAGSALSSDQVILEAGVSTTEGQINPVDLSSVNWNAPGQYTVYLYGTYDGVVATPVPVTIHVAAAAEEPAAAMPLGALPTIPTQTPIADAVSPAPAVATSHVIADLAKVGGQTKPPRPARGRRAKP